MELLTNDQIATLLANGAVTARGEEHDPKPVVKLFTPVSNATWLLTELDPLDPDLAFGLCDLGLGCPELGYVRISELQSVRGRLGPRCSESMRSSLPRIPTPIPARSQLPRAKARRTQSIRLGSRSLERI